MRRFAALCLTLVLGLSLAACSAGGGETTPSQSQPVQSEPVQSEPVQSQPVQSEPVQSEPVQSEPVQSEPVQSEPVQSEPVQSEPVQSEPVPSEPVQSEPVPSEPVEETKVLVAYFSWSGNTETLAGMIQDAAGGDLFEIRPATPYTSSYNELLDVAQAEQRSGARPALAELVDNWAEYDVVFVGYPNWWSDVPMVILSFLEAHDCAGKTIIPFATSGGGGFGRGVSSITNSATGATILQGFHVGSSRVNGAASAVADWVAGLGL